MTDEQTSRCQVIIHAAALAAAGAGAGLAQVPCADAAVIVPIQISMILALAAIFEVSFSRTTAQATLATKTATFVGRGLSQLLLGWLPGIGNTVNALTAAGVTEAIGWAIAKDFAGGLTGKNV